MKKPELLSPAGNYEKFEAAIRYGADAVYLAGQSFGMRAAADNFTVEQIRSAALKANACGKRVFVTVNTMPRDYEYKELAEYLATLRGSGISALIVADLGVMSLARELLPDVEIHVSTQASVVSARAAEQYLRLGCKRVVLARELTFEEIKSIRQNTSSELELEAFVHGSMCISYSGRCLLSNHFTGRDGNRGRCAQPCRWNYHLYEVVEENRPNDKLVIEENDLGTFIMSSMDMCMIEHIPELIEAGIDSFKIEGRMKSAYYTAVTANAYRCAIDAYCDGTAHYQYNPAWMSELESVSHREYCTGFYFQNPGEFANTVTRPGYVREKAYLAIAVGYDATTGDPLFEQRNKFTEGEKIELVTPGQIGRVITAENIKNEYGEKIDSVPHPLMRFTMDVPFEVKVGDILRGHQNS